MLAVTGNTLDVMLPEGTKELTVPDDFRFTVNGQPLSVHQLKPGMKAIPSARSPICIAATPRWCLPSPTNWKRQA